MTQPSKRERKSYLGIDWNKIHIKNSKTLFPQHTRVPKDCFFVSSLRTIFDQNRQMSDSPNHKQNDFENKLNLIPKGCQNGANIETQTHQNQ